MDRSPDAVSDSDFFIGSDREGNGSCCWFSPKCVLFQCPWALIGYGEGMGMDDYLSMVLKGLELWLFGNGDV